jgi:hypothetical protein
VGGTVYTCGRSYHGGQNLSPNFWKGTAAENISGWSGNTSKGGAYAICVK